jgi:hypothetical protein
MRQRFFSFMDLSCLISFRVRSTVRPPGAGPLTQVTTPGGAPIFAAADLLFLLIFCFDRQFSCASALTGFGDCRPWIFISHWPGYTTKSWSSFCLPRPPTRSLPLLAAVPCLFRSGLPAQALCWFCLSLQFLSPAWFPLLIPVFLLFALHQSCS